MALGIGKRIKQKRLELGLTQMELAQRMGYTSKAAICKVEKGDDNITTDRVKKFAKALDVTEAYLMGWSEIPNDSMIKAIEGREKKTATTQVLYNSVIFGDDLNQDEAIMIRNWRSLNPEEQRMIAEMIAFYKSKKQD